MNKKVLTTAGVGLALLAAVVLVATQLNDGSPGPAREPIVAEPDEQPPLSESPGVLPSGEQEGDVSIGVDVGETRGFGVGGTVAASGGPATGAPAGDGVAPPLPQLLDRKIVRNATIGLGVEDVGAAVQSVESIALGAGGFVSSSSVFIEEPPQPLPLPEEDAEPPERTQTASVTIRVPAAAYASVMSQLRGIAKEVESESSQASDVSEEFADLEARLRNLGATEARYLDLLSRAETIPDILALQDRLNSVRLEIETTQGRINLLNNLTDLATITTQLRPFVPAAEPPAEQGWAEEAAAAAWERSQEAMQVLGTVAIVTGVVLAWLAVPALALVVGWRLLGRPRRGEA